MTHRVQQIPKGRGGWPEGGVRPASGKCTFPIWAAIDPARHIRICERPVETGVPTGETK